MGQLNCDHIKRLTTLTSDYIKWLSLFFNNISAITRANAELQHPLYACIFCIALSVADINVITSEMQCNAEN